jgi:SAM-dependent methyltransferase
MIYERLVLMRDLLAEDGFIVIHMGDKVSALVKLVADEVFGEINYRNTIIIPRGIKNVQSQFEDIKGLSVGHDVLIFFSKNAKSRVKKLSLPGTDKAVGKWDTFWRGTDRPTMRYRLFEIEPNRGQWRWSRERAEQAKRNYEEFLQQYNSDEHLDEYYSNHLENGNDLDFVRLGPSNTVQYFVPPRDYKLASTLWSEIRTRGTVTQYSTEKNEQLLSVLVDWLSREGDLVVDVFCGSGTTAAVAEKLGRKWIVADLGKFAIHTTRKRMIGVQRLLKTEGKDYRAFEILNLGKYERQHYIGVNPNLREAEQQKQLEEKESAFVDLILRAYRAEKTEGFATFHGKKAGRMVSVGPINMPVTRLFVEEVILDCRKKHISRVDILGFEFEMGLFPNVLDEARAKGIDIAPKYIPAEVFDKRAVEKNQVVFHDVAAIEVKPLFKNNRVAVELTDFSVFYSQDSIASAEAVLKDKTSKIVVERGQIVKVSKDKDGIVSREVLTQHWTDWIDYWAVDFNFESKREIVRVQNEDRGEWEEVWTGDYIFENEWQSFRTKKDRSLELTSVFHECKPGRRKLAVKVVDIFGNDTMTIVDVNVGEKK